MVKVSIIMPVHNGAWSIRQSINSIQVQNFTSWELLVIDDHSTDEPSSIISEIGDHRIHLLVNPSKGVSSARNLGIEVAQGEYITYLDADDIMYTDALSARVQALDDNPDWLAVYCDTEVVDRDFNELGWQIATKNTLSFEDMFGNPLHLNAIMIRSEILKKYRFPEHLSNGEDWLLNSRILRSGMKWHHVNGCRVCYRIHSQSTVMKNMLAHEKILETVIDVIYDEDIDCPNPLPQYRYGLTTPPKEIVIKSRYYNLLTNRILDNDNMEIIHSISRKLIELSNHSVERSSMITGIQYTYMRIRTCHSSEWRERFRSEQAMIRPKLALLREDLPDYVETMEYLFSDEPLNAFQNLSAYERATGRLKILRDYYLRWPGLVALLVIGFNIAATLNTPLSPLYALISSILLFGLLGHIATKSQHVTRR